MIAIRAVHVGFYGWWPWIGIEPDRDAARVCAHYYTDVYGEDVSRCDPPVCAISGTIRLSRVPTTEEELAGTAVALDVTFPGGGNVSGRFLIP